MVRLGMASAVCENEYLWSVSTHVTSSHANLSEQKIVGRFIVLEHQHGCRGGCESTIQFEGFLKE